MYIIALSEERYLFEAPLISIEEDYPLSRETQEQEDFTGLRGEINDTGRFLKSEIAVETGALAVFLASAKKRNIHYSIPFSHFFIYD